MTITSSKEFDIAVRFMEDSKFSGTLAKVLDE